MEGLGTTVRRLLEALDGDVKAQYDAMGVEFRPRYYPVARLLLASEGLPLRAISAQSGVSHSATSQTVSEMRMAGLVVTAPGADGRERIVKLSASGQAVCQKLQPLWQAVGRAAEKLDLELPVPIGVFLGQVLDRLNEESFYTRISRELEENA
jgi:DNA-binding MarR family transcriptional regulator